MTGQRRASLRLFSSRMAISLPNNCLRTLRTWMIQYPVRLSTVAYRSWLRVVIRKIDVGQENKFYALNGSSETFKAQVICSDCDRIHDVDAPFMEWYGKTVSEKLGLEVKDQRLQVQAECPEFRKMEIAPGESIMIKENTVSPLPLQLFRQQTDKKELTAEQKEILRLKEEKNAILSATIIK